MSGWILSEQSADAHRCIVVAGRRTARSSTTRRRYPSTILDVTPADALTEGDPVVFEVTLDRGPIADVTLDYTCKPDGRNDAHQAMPASGDSARTADDDYSTSLPVLGAAGQARSSSRAPSRSTFPVQTAATLLVERDETFWV